MIGMRLRRFVSGNISRRHIRTAIVASVAMSCFLVVFLLFRQHLLWLCKRHFKGLEDVVAIPTLHLPPASVPSDWIQCSIGDLVLCLPSEFATNRNEISGYDGTIFASGVNKVIVGPSACGGDVLHLVLPDTFQPRGKENAMTVPQLKLECYRACSDMFSWSMTSSQVQRHSSIMEISQIVRPVADPIHWAEYYFDDGVDVVIAFGDNRAILDWERKIDSVGGYIHFIGEQNDYYRGMIRSVCRSIVRSVSSPNK